jgi:hypothetical protein
VVCNIVFGGPGSGKSHFLDAVFERTNVESYLKETKQETKSALSSSLRGFLPLVAEFGWETRTSTDPKNQFIEKNAEVAVGLRVLFT